jgi:hypothetical protein
MGKMTFYGTLQGNGSKQVTRGGSKDSGLQVEAAGWNGRVQVQVFQCGMDGEDFQQFRVVMLPHWSREGPATVLAEGILNCEIAEDAFIVPALFA